MVYGSRREEAAVAEAAAAAAVTVSGRRKPRLSGSLSQLILQAFENSSAPRKVLSLLAIKKYLTEAGYAVNKNSQRLKRELRSLVSHGLLIRATGSGASGSFQLNSNQAKAKRTGKADPRKKKKATAANKPSVGKGEPQKKARKKQPAISKPKGPQSKTSVSAAKKQPNKHPATPVPAKKAAKRRN